MRGRRLTLIAGLTVVIALASAANDAAGQAPAAPKSGVGAGGLPRVADGHPDLEGTYDLATLTPLQRAAGSPLILTPEQAKTLEAQAVDRSVKADAPLDGGRAAPPKGGDGSPGPAGNVGGYNFFWLDPGSQFTMIDGQKRASLLIDPQDGRIPPVTEAARQRRAADVRPTSDQAAREEDPGFEGGGAYDDPERRPLSERCIVG